MTLVELLVVVMIMIILLGIAIPAVKLQLQDRKVREASRQFNAFLRTAQARAAQANRPVGVTIIRDDLEPNIAYQMYYAETPPPYVGETLDAGVTAVTPLTILSPPYRQEVAMAVPWVGSSPPPWLVRVRLSGAFALQIPQQEGIFQGAVARRGDRIRFNHTGPEFLIYDVCIDESGLSKPSLTSDKWSTAPPEPPDVGDLYQGTAPAPGEIVIGPTQTDSYSGFVSAASSLFPGAKFEIARRPQRTTSGSLALPEGTAILLSLSGFNGVIGITRKTPMDPWEVVHDLNEFAGRYGVIDQNVVLPASNTWSITVMFRPDGAVDRVYYGRGDGAVPDGPIHFLVGRADVDERLPPNPNPPSPSISVKPLDPTHSDPQLADPLTWQNLEDLSNLWVTVHHRTGTITTAAMQDWRIDDAPGALDNDTLVRKTRAARQFTHTAQSVGGN
jgi:type II secretory pathway pseudopilin PulG